jgi:GDP-L-fucose synthase
MQVENKPKILITGGNGYIAKSLYSSLCADYDVSIISRRDFDLTNGYSVFQYMRNRYFDIVIHCAISGGSRLKNDDASVIDSNLLMYYNLYNNRSSFGKLISFGSGAELGNPIDPYGLSKYVIRQSILSTPNFYNLRIFGVFDENELDTRFIKANIKRYIDKQPLIVYKDKFMDFYYMKDLISLVKYYIKENGDNLLKEYNCSYHNVYTLKKIATMINNLDDHEVSILVSESGFGPHYYIIDQPRVIPYKMYLHLRSNIGFNDALKEVYNKLKEK